ncbi:MAG: FkbM family methyltransferase [Chloroflexota bacterium]|nr:FkbM family methyltransferase [Chloroflexota bacterium]
MKRVLVRILKRVRLLRAARRLWFRWNAIQPWGEPRRRRRAMLPFYSQFIGEHDLCFDVGANMGDRTEVFVKLGGRVVAVEPQDVCVGRLRKKYGENASVRIVPKALGEKEGEAEMMLSKAHAVSSLSKEWIESVKASGRLSDYRWEGSVMVPVTTLDRLIEEYGQPDFCKVDVEGFEFEVVKGLSQPIRAMSLEYNPDFIGAAIESVRRLAGLGMRWFNYSEGESMRLSLAEYVEAEEMCDILAGLPDEASHGDVYATCDPSLARVTS